MITRTLLLGVALSFAMVPAAFAGNHGSSNTAVVIQSGKVNLAFVGQSGQKNVAIVGQFSNPYYGFNAAVVVQNGHVHH